MITKETLAAGMVRECDICRHLFAKLEPSAFTYRPSPGQRTTLELLRYLAICGVAGLRCMSESNWKLFGEYLDRVKDMPAEAFPVAMEAQAAEIMAFFTSVSEETLETQEALLPGGGTRPLGEAILGGPFKWLTAYKLQLFLYAKVACSADIGTSNAWGGVDRKV